MKSVYPLAVASLLITALCTAEAPQASNAQEAPNQAIVTRAEAAAAVTVMNVSGEDGVVSGVLVNNTGTTLRDVKMLIHHTWLWANERHPGSESPGRTDTYTLNGPVPPHGSVPFSYRGTPLPERSDGYFTTTAEVVSFTQIGVSAL